MCVVELKSPSHLLLVAELPKTVYMGTVLNFQSIILAKIQMKSGTEESYDPVSKEFSIWV